VLLVVRPTYPMATGPSTTVFTALGAAFATALAMLLLRRVGKTETPEVIAFHFSMFAGIVHAGIAVFDLRVPTPRSALLMVLAGCFGGLGKS
jgi:drug/metabolite transporter (DMT)-like permease